MWFWASFVFVVGVLVMSIGINMIKNDTEKSDNGAIYSLLGFTISVMALFYVLTGGQ